MARLRTVFTLAIGTLMAVAFALPASTQSTTTCPAANPFDNLPDDAALQACLDNTDRVELQPPPGEGYTGYLIATTLRMRRDGQLLSTYGGNGKARLVAAPSLASPILRASGSGYEISSVRFDGNRAQRAVRDRACSAVRDYRNVDLAGAGYHIRYVESTGAVCGSAMTVGSSSRFEIYGSLFFDNGRQPEDANGITGLWSDGLTVFGCDNSTIRDNDFWDNTDVDLGVNGGQSCAVYRNTITHNAKYAFAGLVAGDPSRSGGEFSNNLVSSGVNLLGFGMVVGCHPWEQCGGGYASNLRVHDNRVSGAVVNLAVDGLNGGTVERNQAFGSQGTRAMNCAAPADYTVGHAINVSALDPGYVVRTYDFATACR